MRRIHVIALLALALCLVSVGCTSTRQLDKLSLQMDVIEEQNNAIVEKLIEADSLNRTLLEALNTFKARTEFTDKAGDARLDEVSAKMNDLIDRTERLQQSIAALQTGLVSSPRDTSASGSADTSQAVRTLVDARAVYDQAFKDMSSQNFALAILGFTEYVKSFPNTDRTSVAHSWIGECHYRQDAFKAALEQYRIIESKYKDSEKLSSSFYKIARCNEELGDSAEAIKYYEKTIGDFPESIEADLAKGKLDSLRAGSE